MAYTTVSATIVDPNGFPYVLALVTANFEPASGIKPATLANGSIFQTVVQAQCDENGTFAMSLPKNADITPVGSTWGFTVQLNETAFSVSGVTISGTSQDLSDTLSDDAEIIFDVTPGSIEGNIYLVDSRGAVEGSHQTVAADLTLDADSGSDTPDTDYLAAAMFNTLADEEMSKTGNYVGGVIGAYSIPGADNSTYPTGAVLAQITDGTEDCKGAVVAYIDGDGSQTNAGAAFKVMHNNSTPGSGFNFGIDLYDASHDGFSAVSYLKGEIRLLGQACIFTGAGVPSGSTGQTFAAKGSLYIDLTNANFYINAGSAGTPSWKLVTRAA